METRNVWPYPDLPPSKNKSISIELAPDSSAMVVTTTASPTTPTIERIRTIYIWLGCAGCLASMLIPFALLGLIGYLFSEPRDPALLMLWVFLIAPALIFVVMYVLHKRIPPDAPYEVGSIPLSLLDPGLDRITPEVINKANRLGGSHRQTLLQEALDALEREGAEAFVSAVNDIDEDPD
ncbi:hypothetical protein KBP53_05465 [Corynebacterium genitalium ATCC 33030]|nr:hypothetical protein [Corynebacterium genitalium]UUA90396.1 hypothetical protein KBP53_05465 [Corynebacterium genitalium ATCC 33030]